MVNNWKNQLIYLYKIPEMEAQATYAAFIRGFKSKFLYFLRIIPDIHEYFQLIEDRIANKLIPTILVGHIVGDVERKLRSLPTRCGGPAISIIKRTAISNMQTQDVSQKN